MGGEREKGRDRESERVGEAQGASVEDAQGKKLSPSLGTTILSPADPGQGRGL